MYSVKGHGSDGFSSKKSHPHPTIHLAIINEASYGASAVVVNRGALVME